MSSSYPSGVHESDISYLMPLCVSCSTEHPGEEGHELDCECDKCTTCLECREKQAAQEPSEQPEQSDNHVHP